MAYFVDNKNLVNPAWGISGDGAVAVLRKAQPGAAWAAASHFSLSSDPALVVMPTGSGKTAVMTLLPFLIPTERVLVVAPSRLVRDQCADEFRSLKILKATGTARDDLEPPKVKRVLRRVSSTEGWEELRNADVVTGTPHSVSPAMSGVEPPPNDLFDLLIIDEAHHAPAATWAELLSSFPTARKVLFTATPFRRDRRVIPGKLLYSYPIAEALKDGVYQEIEFIPVDVPVAGDKDRALATAARDRLRSRDHTDAKSKLLIRTDRISEAERLKEVYRGLGMPVGVIDSRKSLRTVRQTIRRLMDDELVGLVSIGVLGEGFDLPALKIAVYHQRHKSLPATLQFVGRVARAEPEKFKSAELLAVREDVMDETRELYDEDAHWAKLIPLLSEAAVEREQVRRAYLEEFDIPEELRISPHILAPRLLARVFIGDMGHVDLKSRREFERPARIIYRDTDANEELLVVITVRRFRPSWIDSSVLDSPEYSLHMVWVDRNRGLLFVSSTSETAYRQLLDIVGGQDLKAVSPTALNAVLSSVGIQGYSSVGMRSARAPGLRQPSYKILAGSEVQTAISPSDGRGFGLGHAIGRYSDDGVTFEGIGVSVGKSKIWSIKSGGLLEYREWCERIARALVTAPEAGTSVPLTSLRVPDQLSAFPAKPIGIVWNPKLLRQGPSIVVGGDANMLTSYDAEVVREDERTCRITLMCEDGNALASVRLKVGEDVESVGEEIIVHSSTRSFDPLPLHELVQEFPPSLYFADGSSVEGQVKYIASSIIPATPPSVLEQWDWSSTEITNEDGVAGAGLENVQETVARVVRSAASASIVIKDHGTGEIADFVVLDEESSGSWRVSLYHCKASSGDNPGLRLDDISEVCSQGLKSIRWAQTKGLFSELARRLMNRASTQLLSSGDNASLAARLDTLSEEGRPIVGYSVYLVQPGLDTARIDAGLAVNTLLLSTYEWLSEQGVDLKVVGS